MIHPTKALLLRAIEVTDERRTTYGPPGEHFEKTVGMINALFARKLREPLTIADWAQVMILDKLARHQGNGGTSKSADTPIDLAGYAACLAEVETSG
jgi:lysozyme family protein